MNAILDFWAHQPVVITQFVTQILVLLVAFGVPVTDAQRAAVVAIVEAVGAIVSAIVLHNTVTSPATAAKLIDQIPGGQAFIDAKAANPLPPAVKP